GGDFADASRAPQPAHSTWLQYDTGA
ncbi:MAG: hypothetical protein QOH43_1932, partial [Solirubrobacteraceae bacterium]|nr:hypothetical protein [Solirubrobacteraceae bacterium]